MKHDRFQVWVNLALSVLVTAGSFPLEAMAATDWYMLTAGGRPIGKVQVKSYRQKGEQAATVTEVSNVNHFRRAGNPFEMNTVSRFVENPVDGKPLHFSYHYDLGDQRLLQAEGKVHGDTLALQMVSDSEVQAGEASLSGEQFLFPGGPGIEKVYKTHYNDEPGSRFSFQTLNLGVQPQIVDTEVTIIGTEKLALADGKPLRKFEVRNPVSADSTVYEWRDDKGKLFMARSVGSDMEMIHASRQQVRKIDRTTLDLVTDATIMTNIIPQPRVTTEALYRIAPLTGQSVNWEKAFPEGDRQKIVESGVAGLSQALPDAMYLKVFQKPPEDSQAQYPIRFDKIYLQNTPYLQTTDVEIERLAAEIVGKEKRAFFAGKRLQHWIHKNIEQKDLSLGFASAKETLERKQGDCTEHAVLLTAMARSLGIPSRVATGLVYQPQGNETLGRLVYHMWTEIYVGNPNAGEWVPLDASYPDDMVDATHIKIADSPLANTSDLLRLTQQVANLMGKIKVDVVQAKAPAQSILSIDNQPGSMTVEIPKIDIEQVDVKSLSRKAIKRFRVDAPPHALSKETSEGLFTYGVQQLSKDQYDEAVSSFRQAMAKLRRPVEFYRMGERLASMEMYGLAEESLRMSMQADPHLSPLVESWMSSYIPSTQLSDSQNRKFIRAVSLQLDSQDSMGAARLFQEITREAPGFAPAWRHLGEVLDGPEAVNALNQAVATAPADYRNADALGDTLMDQNQYAAAAKAYKKAVDTLKNQTYAQSKPWLDEIQGKLRLANGSSMLARNKRSAAGWLETGKGLLMQNRLDEATKAFNNAAKLQPGSTEAQVYRFLANLRNTNWKALEASRGTITNLAGSNPFAARLLGQYQVRLRQYPYAIRTLKQAIAMEPTNRDAYMTLSSAYQRMAEQEQAEQQAGGKQATHLAVYRKQREDALRQGLAKTSSNWDTLFLNLQLAKVLLSHGKASEAQPLTEEAISISPMNAQAHLLRGKSLFYQGNYEQAKETLEVAQVLNPNDGETLTLLGHVALETGKDSLALDYYQKAHKADPGNVEAANALRNLITQMKIAAKKPPAYQMLSGDERDFAVQLMVVAERVKRNNVEYLRKASALLGDKGDIEFSVKGIESMQAFVPVLSKIYDQEVTSYNKLKAMQVPPRFRALHYQMMALGIKHMEIYQDALKRFPAFQSPKEIATGRAAYEELMEDLEVMEDQATAELANFAASVPEAVFNGIVYDAKLDNLAELNSQQALLTSELSGKIAKRGKSQKKATSPGMNLPPGMSIPAGMMPSGMPGLPAMPAAPSPATGAK